MWPWFRSQRHGKAIVFQHFCCKKGVRIMLKKRHTWPHLTKCIAVMTKKNSRSRMTRPKKHWFLGSQASKCSQISSARNGGNVYHFESDSHKVVRYDCSVRCFSSLFRAIFQRLAVTRSQAQAHAKIGHVFEAEDEPWPETRCNQWTSMQDLTDIAMACHGSVVSIPAVQLFPSNETPVFVERWYREILVLKASFRIRLVMVWNHVESACNESASNSQRLEQGARLGQLCRYKRERTKTRRSSRWSFCRKICIYLKEARREIKRLLGKRATVRVSTCVRHSCMHLQGALRLSIWSVCKNVKTTSTWSKISRLSLDAGMQQAERMKLSWRQVVYKHIQTDESSTPDWQLSFARCRSAFPDDRLLAWRSWSEVKMSSHNHPRPSNNLMNVSC